jgi:hypothetical protein
MGRLYRRQLESALDLHSAVRVDTADARWAKELPSTPAASGLGPCVVTDDGRIGVPLIPRISQGIAAMTPTEMEEAIRNLQLQANRIEQFLPNLATRGGLYAVRDDLVAVRDALRLEIQDARRHAVILNEATRDDIKLLAESLARVEATMATKEELKEAIGGLERTFGGQIDQLASQVGQLATQVGQLATQVATLAKRRKN